MCDDELSRNGKAGELHDIIVPYPVTVMQPEKRNIDKVGKSKLNLEIIEK